jgi:thiol-disulfide isomerase/thioredoxin
MAGPKPSTSPGPRQDAVLSERVSIMLRSCLSLALVLALAAPAWAWDDDEPKVTLKLGDAAPKLAFKEFVKGEPVTTIEKDKIYVLEFWATWCGPCIRAIPHVTELQKKYPKVVFIGVNVWEEETDKVKPFVEKMGDKMDYRVAIDENPEGGKGTMATTWLAAAGQNGIPCSIIVNGAGQVAWIGHPMEMDKPLEQIVAGKYDIQAAVAEAKRKKEMSKKLDQYRQKLTEAMNKGPAEALKVIDEMIEAEPMLEARVAMFKFNLLRQVQKPDQLAAHVEKMITKFYADEAQALNNLAWTMVDPENPMELDARLKKLALQAAKRADELVKSEDGPIADTLARALFVNGDLDQAITVQERAVKLSKGTEHEKELTARLEEYKKAKQNKK